MLSNFRIIAAIFGVLEFFGYFYKYFMVSVSAVGHSVTAVEGSNGGQGCHK